jgi:hypothetical protein
MDVIGVFLGVLFLSTWGAVLFWFYCYRPLEEKALQWHKERDTALRKFETAEMDRREWQQRCEFLTEQLKNASPSDP